MHIITVGGDEAPSTQNLKLRKMKNITEMTTAEMIAEFNELTGKSTKKFSSRAAGEKQLTSARRDAEFVQHYGTATCPHCGTHLENGVGAHGMEVNDGKLKLEKHEFYCMACGEEFGPLLDASKNAVRSEAVAESWNDPSVAAKRSRRDRVWVGNDQYRSVKHAFELLNLPLNQHIKFRMSLKANGVESFEHAGKVYNFKIA